MSQRRNVTPWFPVAVDPVHEGIYEVEYRQSRFLFRREWRDGVWCIPSAVLLPATRPKRWRGLTAPNSKTPNTELVDKTSETLRRQVDKMPETPSRRHAIENDTEALLRLCADDPMWTAHAEVSKSLLVRAADELAALRDLTRQSNLDAMRVGKLAGDVERYSALHARLFAEKTAAQIELEGLREALFRIWPAVGKAMAGLVFTADRAGEIAADMSAICAAIAPKEPANES